MTTGEKIKARRLELGMTMDDLGNAIGVQRSAINKYEKDKIKWNLSQECKTDSSFKKKK